MGHGPRSHGRGLTPDVAVGAGPAPYAIQGCGSALVRLLAEHFAGAYGFG